MSKRSLGFTVSFSPSMFSMLKEEWEGERVSVFGILKGVPIGILLSYVYE